MFKKIRLLKQLKDDSNELEVQEEQLLNENNEALIYVNCDSASDIISKYSSGDDLTINSELSSFLEDKNENLSINYPVNIKINNSKQFNNEEKNKVKLSIRNHFANKVNDINEKLHKNKIECIVLFLISLLTLLSYVACKLIFKIDIVNEIISEILLIIAWVFVWRLVESIAFERRKMKFKAIKFYRLLNARIEFYN
ncbi:MAG: hypothetical protein E7359_04545 [Clostridiales bacterium]|nr:hypothetical protein [Clostridiales bacterium]